MNTPTNAKPGPRPTGRLTRRLSLVLASVVAISSLLLGGLAIWNGRQTMFRDFDQRLMTIARLAALQISGDDVRAALATADERSPGYQAIAARLVAIREAEDVSFVYIAARSTTGTGRLMIDGSAEPEPMGTDYGVDTSLNALYATKKVTVSELVRDRDYGLLKTAYAPIFASDGRMVAAVGIDLSADALNAAFLRSVYILIAIWLVIVLLSTAIAVRAARAIAARVVPLAEKAARLAAGDLAAATGELNAGRVRDEIDVLGNSLRSMHFSLISLVRELRGNSSQVIAAAGQLSAAVYTVSTLAAQADQAMNQVATGTVDQAQNAGQAAAFLVNVSRSLEELAGGAGEQAAVVSDAAAQAGEIARVTEQVVDRAESASVAAKETTSAAQAGGAAVGNTVSAVTQIAGAVNQAAASMEKLNTQAARIGQISTTIRELADQSNMLALNAAIEAARAGEHGRGFAVVADEVRKLAVGSGTSADQIRRILQGISETVTETLSGMQSALTAINAGMAKAGQAGQALERIVESATLAQEQIETVASDSRTTAISARAIAAGAERAAQSVLTSVNAVNAVAADSQRVDGAVHSVAAISEETAALAGTTQKQMSDVARTLSEVSAALMSLSAVAGDLEEAVARFKM